jgi:hypothetical protein
VPTRTTQRETWMWMGADAKYAAYCNPNLSGRASCALQKNCCGTGMVQDGTFGTHWEFTPSGGGSNDFVNLSTNAGSGPHSPPKLCGPGVDPDDCVTKAANIFYNVPIAWTTNLDCNFTSQSKKVRDLQCVSVDCPDAYTHPQGRRAGRVSCRCPGLRGEILSRRIEPAHPLTSQTSRHAKRRGVLCTPCRGSAVASGSWQPASESGRLSPISQVLQPLGQLKCHALAVSVIGQPDRRKERGRPKGPYETRRSDPVAATLSVTGRP